MYKGWLRISNFQYYQIYQKEKLITGILRELTTTVYLLWVARSFFALRQMLNIQDAISGMLCLHMLAAPSIQFLYSYIDGLITYGL